MNERTLLTCLKECLTCTTVSVETYPFVFNLYRLPIPQSEKSLNHVKKIILLAATHCKTWAYGEGKGSDLHEMVVPYVEQTSFMCHFQNTQQQNYMSLTAVRNSLSWEGNYRDTATGVTR